MYTDCSTIVTIVLHKPECVKWKWFINYYHLCDNNNTVYFVPNLVFWHVTCDTNLIKIACFYALRSAVRSKEFAEHHISSYKARSISNRYKEWPKARSPNPLWSLLDCFLPVQKVLKKISRWVCFCTSLIAAWYHS